MIQRARLIVYTTDLSDRPTKSRRDKVQEQGIFRRCRNKGWNDLAVFRCMEWEH